MTTNALRQKIAEYIHFADEKKVKAIYNLLEENINQKREIWTKEFTLEMNKRASDIETNKVKPKNKTQVINKATSLIRKINNGK